MFIIRCISVSFVFCQLLVLYFKGQQTHKNYNISKTFHQPLLLPLSNLCLENLFQVDLFLSNLFWEKFLFCLWPVQINLGLLISNPLPRQRLQMSQQFTQESNRSCKQAFTLSPAHLGNKAKIVILEIPLPVRYKTSPLKTTNIIKCNFKWFK